MTKHLPVYFTNEMRELYESTHDVAVDGKFPEFCRNTVRKALDKKRAR